MHFPDSFLEVLSEVNSAKGVPCPTTLGLALACQVLEEEVPMEDHDR
jgi:5-formyltetrahydrofolate cyclo-ligase